jgi:hypothetical protein
MRPPFPRLRGEHVHDRQVRAASWRVTSPGPWKSGVSAGFLGCGYQLYENSLPHQRRGFGEHEAVRSTLIAPQYPNGLAHETGLDQELEPGDRFDLYRRAWVAEQWTTTGRTRLRGNEVDPPRLLCVPADSAAVRSKVA